MAENLDIDVIYLYDSNLTITHSSDDKYIGWITLHPIRTRLL
jgi:hypothetical protein